MAKKKTKPSESGHAVSLRMKYVGSPEVKPAFANHMLVQSDESMVYLTFFQAQPPVILGNAEEVRRQVEELTEMPAKMVAQVLVPRDRIAKFVKAIAANIESSPTLREVQEDRTESNNTPKP
jgi:hypothetical protein